MLQHFSREVIGSCEIWPYKIHFNEVTRTSFSGFVNWGKILVENMQMTQSTARWVRRLLPTTHTQKNGTICFEHYLFKPVRRLGSLRAIGGGCWHCVGLVALQAHTLCVSAGYTDGLVAKTRWAEIEDSESKTRQVWLGLWLQGAQTGAAASSHQRQTPGACVCVLCVGNKEAVHMCAL